MKKKSTWMRWFANALFVILISAVSGLGVAQTTTGSIYGSVTDNTGGVVPKAVLTVTNVRTGLTHTTQSNDGGDYIFPALDPGDYSISARSESFNVETQQGLRLDANQNVHVSFALQPGSVDQTVTVSAATTLVDTRESQLGETVDQRRIEDLPLNGRQAYDLVQIIPGITSYSQLPPNGNQAGVKFAVNGNRTNQNSFYLDGAADTAVFSTGGNLMPNPDALLEFRLLTSNFDAEYGRSPGGVVNAITRSGSNAFHGLLYEYLRNNVLNAKNYFSTRVTPLHQNQYGANIGGPIKPNRTFFFLSYQGLQIATPAQIFAGSQNTPTAAEIAGDFTGSVSTVKPHQPGSQAPFSCGGVVNVICPNLIDPVAKAALAYVPPANVVGTTRISQAQTASANTSQNQGLVRLDHQLTPSHQLSGSYFTSRGTSLSPGTNNNAVYSFSGLVGYANQTNAIASDTWTISPNTLNSLRLFYTLNHFVGSNIYSAHTLADLGSQAGIGSAPATQPQFIINGYFSMGMGSGGVDNQYQQAWGGEDTLNWTLGRHNLKLGGSYTWNKYRENGAYLGSGTATFSGGTTGNAFADFLLGRASSFRQNNGANHRLHEFAPALFAQDDFKISKKLTLDLGLRWEVFAPFVGENNFGTFSPGVQSTVFPTAPLGLLSVGDPGINDGIMHTNWKAFAPRVGFAYDLYGDGKTGLRGGYGIFYAARSLAQITNLEQQPYILDITLNSTPNLVTPYGPGTDPFPYAANPKAPIFISGATVSGIPPNASFPYTQEFNLTLEQQLATQLGLRVAYVGSVSRKYYIARDQNSAVYLPTCPSASCSTTTANINSRRPYQPTPAAYTFGEISQNDPVGNASYNSLQVTLTRSFSHGFSVLASYVWAKSLDISSVDPANITLTLSDENNPARDKGVSDFDVPNRFVASYLWSTPDIHHFGIVGRELLSGWQLNGITTVSDGLPFNITSGVDSNFDGTATTDRPNVVGNPFLPRSRSRREKIAQYFNTAALAPVPVGTPYGNASRNMMFAPGVFTTDFSAFKKFTLHKEQQVEFRAELYNLFNNVNLSAPVAVRTNAQFGQINAAGTPRVIQFALRYSF